MLLTMNIKKIVKVIEWIIFIFLIGILFLVLSPLLPTKQYISTYVISTGSMEPTISTGSVVFTTQQDTYEIGDIVAFESPTNSDITVIHRISDIQNNEYITKGDNNDSADNWSISKENIKGKMIWEIPFLGNVIEWMKTPIGFAILLGIPSLLIAIIQIRKIKDGINEEVEKRTSEEVAKRLSE